MCCPRCGGFVSSWAPSELDGERVFECWRCWRICLMLVDGQRDRVWYQPEGASIWERLRRRAKRIWRVWHSPRLNTNRRRAPDSWNEAAEIEVEDSDLAPNELFLGRLRAMLKTGGRWYGEHVAKELKKRVKSRQAGRKSNGGPTDESRDKERAKDRARYRAKKLAKYLAKKSAMERAGVVAVAS